MHRNDGSRIAGAGRRVAATVLAGLFVAAAGTIATPDRAEAVTCPAGTVQLGILCIRTSSPTAPQPTTTTAPPVAAPPVTLPPVTAPPVAPPTPAVSAPDGARRLLDLVNGERAKAGLGSLAWRDDVAAIARSHSEKMAAAGDIFHSDSFFGASVKNLLNVVTRGENVAYNGTIDGAHARLMASSGHRANILDRSFNAVGIGVVRHADGRYFITQDFVQGAGAPAPRPAPAAPKAAKAKPAATPRPAPRPAATTAAPTTAAPTTAAPTTTTDAPPIVPDDAATLSLASAAPQVLTAVPSSASSRVTAPLVAAAVALVLVLMALACWLIPRRLRP